MNEESNILGRSVSTALVIVIAIGLIVAALWVGRFVFGRGG